MAANDHRLALPTSLLNRKRSKDREFLQEYLLKVIEREKQTEQLSFTMLHSLEDMEQRVNVMSIYLEKMQLLQNRLFSQPSNQPEPERDLFKSQSIGHRFLENTSSVQETQFLYVNDHQSMNEYSPNYQTAPNFIQSNFPRIGVDSESHLSYNSTENGTRTSLQTDPKFANTFQYHDVGCRQVLQPTMELELQQLNENRVKGANDKSFSSNLLNAYHADPLINIKNVQKERTVTITGQQDSIYTASRENSPPVVDDMYAIKKKINDLQHVMASLTSQSKDQRVPCHVIEDKYNSMNYSAGTASNPYVHFSAGNPGPNNVPKETVLVKNRNHATLNNGIQTIKKNINMPHIVQHSKSENNETDEIYQNVKEKDFKQNKNMVEGLQQSMNNIPLEQNQELRNDTNVYENDIEISLQQKSENKIDASVSESFLKGNSNKKKESIDESLTSILNNERDNLGPNEVETEVNDSLETQVASGINMHVIKNTETRAGPPLEIEEINVVKTKIADSIETEITDQVETEITESSIPETIDKAKHEMADNEKTLSTNKEKTESTNREKTETTNKTKIKIVNRVETGAVDRMKLQTMDKAKIEATDRAKTKITDEVQMDIVDKENSEISNKVKELSHINRKNNVQTVSQVLKSSQSISSKVESPIVNRKRTKIRRKSKSRRDGVLARKSSVLLSGESSESGGNAFDKGLSLTSSAAYKSLIGAAPILPETQKATTTESESENDVERALAMAMHKTSVDVKIEENSPKKSKVPAFKQDIGVELKASTTTQPRKTSLYPSTTQKMKLTKASRLALGLDSESDSPPVQSSIKKEVEEESDEFDFFS